MRRSFALLVCLALVALAPTPLWAQSSDASLAEIPEGLFDAFSFRHVGPLGNRVPAVVGEPGNPNVYYAGAASGGIWTSTDGGHQWRPVFDDQAVSSIGSLAVAPSDPNVVWAGTGESFIRANISIGNGVYRSTDKGETWAHLGLENTGRIGRVVVHPDDPDTAFVAALGHTYGDHPERGLYRTTDGGETWEKVLFVDEKTGAIDVVMDPTNPRILFAATWQIRVWTAGRESGGPGSGLWKSTDGGTSWHRLEGAGLPNGPWGKIGLGMSAANPKRVYALIETSSNRDYAPSDPFAGVLWRSDDQGGSWRMVSADNNLAQRPLYYSRMAVSPDDADEVHFMAVRHTRSIDGGKSVEGVNAGYDHHDMWIDPVDPDRMVVGHDGGVSISTDRGRHWYQPQLPIAQMYHVATDSEIPYNLYGNRQDGPSTHGPSNSLTFGPIPIGAWRSVGGCEVGFAIPHPAEPNIVWSGCYDGILDIHDRDTGHSRNVSVWPIAIESWPGEDLEYRFQWTFPVEISPHDPERVYVGSQYVHETTNRGQSWQAISPDLTTADPELMRRYGGLTLDDAGPTLAPTVFAIAESPIHAGEIWVGTNDGKVQLTRDGGETWSDVTPAIRGLPTLGTISNIEPSHHQDGTAYLTIDAHQEGDFAPYVLRTRDFGASWKRIDGDLPTPVAGWAHCVREDPVRAGLLYLGTENALYVSFDDGGAWHRLRAGLPTAPVHWLEIQPHFHDLVVATYGRGFWILDDITPLRAIDAALLEQDRALLEPRFAYRFRMVEAPMMQPNDPAAGTNPDYGAAIHLWLAEDLDAPKDEDEDEDEDSDSDDEAKVEATLEIRDADGNVVRTFENPPRTAGLHRIMWDLRGEDSPEVRLRTRPDESPHIGLGDEGWRRLSDGGRLTLLSMPGTYTVAWRVGDDELVAPLEVRKDPASQGTSEDLRAQATLADRLYAGVSHAADAINEIEWARKQIDDLEARLGVVADQQDADPEDADQEDADQEDADQEDAGSDDAAPDSVSVLLEQANALDERLREIEGTFFDLRLTGAGQDSLRWKRLIYARLGFLAWQVGQSDFGPTDSHHAVADQLLGELQASLESLDAARAEIDTFNRALADAGHGGVIFTWNHDSAGEDIDR